MQNYSTTGSEASIKAQKKLIAILLMLAVLPSQLSIDLYLPSLPYIQTALNTTSTKAQETVSWFLIGVSLGPFFYGTLADRFGRKIVLLSGLFVYLVVTLFCIFATSIQMLLAARFIQGLSIASILINRAILRDVFDGKELVKYVAYLSLAWAMTPILAPFFGGIIQYVLGWRANFAFLFLFSAFLFIVFFKFLPETNATPLTSLNLKQVGRSYISVLKNKTFMSNVFACSLSYAALIAFSTAGPFLLQKSFNLSPMTYGTLALFVAFAYLLGNLVDIKLLKIIPEIKLILFGILLFFISCLALLIFSLFAIHTIIVIVIPIFIIIFATGFIYPTCAANAIMPFKQNAGTASAVFTIINIFLCFVVSYIAALLPEQSQLPFAILLLSMGTILLGLYFLIAKL